MKRQTEITPTNAQNRLIYSRQSATREAHPVLFWFLMFLDAFILFAAAYYAILPLQNPQAISYHQQALAVALAGAALVAGIVLIWRMMRYDEMQLVEKEYAPPETMPAPEPEPYREDERRELKIKTIRGEVVIVQPRPGAFSNWLRDVLNPDTKTTFSKNEAKRREWDAWQYTNLVAQLKDIGWIHSSRLLNGAPDIDMQYKNEMSEWLKTPLL